MTLTHWTGGGFAGPVLSRRLGPLDVGALPRPIAGAIHELLGACGFAGLPAVLPAGATHVQTDPLEYRLRVDEAGRAHQVHWDDNADPPEPLRRLVGILAEVEGWADCPWEEWHEPAPPSASRPSPA